MTRINVLPAAALTDRHLIAEYRELPRVFDLARKWVEAGRPGEVPSSYRLGPGHVRFFYPRTRFLARRQAELIAEGLARGFDLSHVDPPDPVPGADADWSPPPEARALNLARLRERLQAKPELYRLRGEPVGLDFYDPPSRVRYLAALRVRPLPATCHAYRFELHEDLADVQTLDRPGFEVWRVELPEEDEPGPVFVRVLEALDVEGDSGSDVVDLDDERHAGETARRFAYSSFGGMIVRDPVAYLPPGGVEPVAPELTGQVEPAGVTLTIDGVEIDGVDAGELEIEPPPAGFDRVFEVPRDRLTIDVLIRPFTGPSSEEIAEVLAKFVGRRIDDSLRADLVEALTPLGIQSVSGLDELEGATFGGPFRPFVDDDDDDDHGEGWICPCPACTCQDSEGGE